MEALLKFDQKQGEIVTIAELDDAELRESIKKGWTLTGVFEAERRASYSKEAGRSLFGVFALPTEKAVIDAVERARAAEEKAAKAESAKYEAEASAKRAMTIAHECQSELAALKLKIGQENCAKVAVQS
jgi:hypothetical protein